MTTSLPSTASRPAPSFLTGPDADEFALDRDAHAAFGNGTLSALLRTPSVGERLLDDVPLDVPLAPKGSGTAHVPVLEGVSASSDIALLDGASLLPGKLAVGGTFGDQGAFAYISLEDGSATGQFTTNLSSFRLGSANATVYATASDGASGSQDGIGIGLLQSFAGIDGSISLEFTQDEFTAGGIVDAIRGTAESDEKLVAGVSVTAAVSVSDIAAATLAGGHPGAIAVYGALTHPDVLGINGFVGVSWEGSVTFANGGIEQIDIAGKTIEGDRINELIGVAAEQTQERASTTLLPNFGNSAMASYNDTLQVVYGQSPWQVGLSAQKRDASGAIELPVDVLNHGNPFTAVTEPFYELGVGYGLLAPGELIRDNAHAGEIADELYHLYHDSLGSGTGMEWGEFRRLANPHGLDFGSEWLAALNKVVYPTDRADDTPFVRAGFSGTFRQSMDM